jgi:MSHA biogenesis protein MshL
LHIHPSVSQVTTDNKVIDLGVAGSLTLPLAKSSVSEADTVVRVADGNIVALGGLMKLDLEDTRGGLPGTGNSAIGNFLRNANTSLVKQEMVILIKPTVVQSARSLDEDLDQARSRFGGLGSPTVAPPPPGAGTR